MEQVEFVDRYTGMPYPCPWTMCKGPCEGMGVYPTLEDDFELCPLCNGTGLRLLPGRLVEWLNLAYTYYYELWFPLWAVWYELRHGFEWTHYPARLKALTRLPYWFKFIHGEQKQQRKLLTR